MLVAFYLKQVSLCLRAFHHLLPTAVHGDKCNVPATILLLSTHGKEGKILSGGVLFPYLSPGGLM
jgi:hypothetical protein